MKERRYLKRAVILLALAVLFIAPLVDAASFLREPRKNTVDAVKPSLISEEPGTLTKTYSTPLRKGSSAARIIGDYGINDSERRGKYYYRPETTIYRQDVPAEFIGYEYNGRSPVSKSGARVELNTVIEQDDVKRTPFRHSRLYADREKLYEGNEDFTDFELKSSRWLAGDYHIKERRGRYYYTRSNVMSHKFRELHE